MTEMGADAQVEITLPLTHATEAVAQERSKESRRRYGLVLSSAPRINPILFKLPSESIRATVSSPQNVRLPVAIPVKTEHD
jgi:hypothetical protein